jgi:hypothetical protein
VVSDELSRKITRACINAGVNPAIGDVHVDENAEYVQFDRLPENCPFPEMQVYSVERWNAREHHPECWRITVMIERWVGSNSLWVPIVLIGPNWHREYTDKSSPQGWTLSFWQDHSKPDSDFDELAAIAQDGWWPTLEEAWGAVPKQYTGYYKHWREESDCERCFCTGIVLFNQIMLPCPECRLVPDFHFGYLGLRWVTAHTPERLPYAEVGKRWRWKYGDGYIVQHVLGDPERVREYPEWECVHVGLKRHEAVDNPDWKWGDDIKVGADWADFDFDETSVALAKPTDRTGWFWRLQRRIASWFHYEEGHYVGPL